MVKSNTIGDRVFTVINTSILLFLTLMALYPCLYVLFASVSNPMELYTAESKILLYPKGFSFAAYDIVLGNANIWRGYRNTLIYVLLGTSVSVFLTSLGGYVLSRRYLPGRKFFIVLITITMFFGGGLIPTFLVVRYLGMLDTIWAMVFPSAINTFNMILMMSFFRSIPDSMEESAKIDGANDWSIFSRIMVPLALPVIAVITLFCIVGVWNSYIPPTIYLRNRILFPLQVILREILLSNVDSSLGVSTSTSAGGYADVQAYTESVKYAVIIVSIVPLLCVYPFIQKYFIKGIMLGAVKG